MKAIKLFILNILLVLFIFNFSFAEKEIIRKLPVEEFISLAVEKDIAFQEILIDELTLKYQKALELPPGDVVLNLKSKYKFLYDPKGGDPENAVSLSKLFPFTGTDVGIEYDSSLNNTTREVSSGFSAYMSQSIAQNAFGRNTRMLDQIIGMEVDVSEYQIVEAYEDYLATVIQTYHNWYSDFENLNTAKDSYTENKKLLENIKEREKHKIALPVDVNKISLQVLAKQESVITLQNKYTDTTNLIKKSILYDENQVLQPQNPDMYSDFEINFEKDYKLFYDDSRTSRILKLLEDKTSLEVDKDADDLLPSIDIVAGYSQDGEGQNIKNSDKVVYAGVSVDWPIPNIVDRAQYQVSKIEAQKAVIHSENVHIRLYTQLKNLNDQINKVKKLIKTAEEKIVLARAIVVDDTRNYSLGRLSLNDLISEVNILENNEFNKIFQEIGLRKLTVEWLRLTDTLVTEEQVAREERKEEERYDRSERVKGE